MPQSGHRTDVSLEVDGRQYRFTVDNRVTLLDALREHLGVTAPKKGCDHGQCGSCTVLRDGQRVTTCLTFVVAADGAQITTAAGLGSPTGLHPVAQAFHDDDAFQCGYCTPGQICSAVGMLDEAKAGAPSVIADDLEAAPELTGDEIRERMSGNLCRCAAYPNIVSAIARAAGA
jgi:xanthine dehydrogenase YagT iron-sulfur-binding subunit